MRMSKNKKNHKTLEFTLSNLYLLKSIYEMPFPQLLYHILNEQKSV